ncbi:MAG: alpha/beta fold hydrolase [Myxococcaceae bacterium]|nr:alpha/beta fold hydrolase [Myxococcaceae bacterium]
MGDIDLGSGESLAVTDVGSGPVVVFSHGTPTWSHEWRHHLKALSGRYRCIAPDHLGFGRSPRPEDGDYRPEAHARRFARLLEVLGVDRYHLVVHDYGGPFALGAALSQPERVLSLTAYNTFAWRFGDSPRNRRMAWLAGTPLFRWAYGALNLSFVISKSAWGDPASNTRETWEPYERVFPDAASRRRVLWALARAMNGSADWCDSLWQRLGALRSTPVHLIWGLADTAFPPSALAKLREAWPHASVLELPTAGHWPHEEQPDVCVESVARFLERQQLRAA